MKNKLITSIGCLLLMAGFTFGQTTQSINLYTSGSTTQTSTTVGVGGTFSLDTYMTFTGFTAVGLSYWLEVSNALAPNITLTSETYTIWGDLVTGDPNSPGTNSTFANTTGVDSGFTRETRDLGATSNFNSDTQMFVDPRSPGTYQVSTLNFTLSGSVAPGTYLIQLTTLSPVPSEINDDQFVRHDVATAVYTLTVVPEPATLSLLGLGGLGSFGLTVLRARRRS